VSQFKKYNPSGSVKFNNLGVSQRLKLRILMEKILRISLKINFIPNTLGGFGLRKYNSRKLGKVINSNCTR